MCFVLCVLQSFDSSSINFSSFGLHREDIYIYITRILVTSNRDTNFCCNFIGFGFFLFLRLLGSRSHLRWFAKAVSIRSDENVPFPCLFHSDSSFSFPFRNNDETFQIFFLFLLYIQHGIFQLCVEMCIVHSIAFRMKVLSVFRVVRSESI